MRLQFHAATDLGSFRSTNEDAYLVRDAEHVFAVADGMGGHAAGEVASQLTIEVLAGLTLPPRPSIGQLRAALAGGIAEANSRIVDDSIRTTEHAGMGTTITALGFTPDLTLAVLAHVGDSRLYRLRASRLDQLTHDHTWVQEQVDAGALTPDQARGHPYANVLTRALGTQDSIEVETAELDIAPDDLYLICSDGLTGMLDDDAIAGIVAPAAPLDRIAQRLIAAAIQRGGFDNITVLLIKVLK